MSARRAALTPATAAAVAMLFTVLFSGLSWLTPASASAAGTTPASAPATAVAAAAADEDDCLGPDIRCDATDAAGDLVDTGVDTVTGVAGAGIDLIPDLPNPLEGLGDTVAQAAADAWIAAMLALWSAGLFVLRLVLAFADAFLTPDLSEGGPGKDVYMYTFWIASSLVIVMAMIQLGVAAFKREGKSLARVAIGAAQFVMVWSCWLAYCVTVVAACGALTKALMGALLGVNTWKGWDPMSGIGTDDITDGVVATVLGLLGCVLWLAALGHLLVMLARAASLIVLVATGPIAAAGLVADAGRSWFWKSLRWFHAAAFTPVLMVMVLGIGVQMSTGVAAGLADDTQKAIGTALPSVMLICISALAPLALFKLLAFVDPGTPSGASFRQGMAMAGGLQGLLSGGGSGSTGSAAASQTDEHGRSSGEAGAESSTSDRFSKSAQSGLSSFGGGVGQALAAGMGVVQKVGAAGTSLMADQTNQAGVGHQTYGPDFSSLRNGGSSSGGSHGHPGTGSDGNDGTGGDDDTSAPPMPTPPAPPTPPTPPTSPTLPAGSQGGSAQGGAGQGGAGGGKPPTPGGGASGAGGSGGAGGAGGAAAGGAAVPPVPV